MKNLQVFLILGCVALSFCGPVSQKPSKDDSEETFDGLDAPFDSDVVDTGFPTGYFGSPFPVSFGFGNPFSGFWKQMEDTMRQLQLQMTKVLHRLPEEEGGFSNWQPIADGKGNTTSTVKVINGHKVTINETVYNDDGDKNSGSFFKIRIVQVKPTSEEETNSQEVQEENVSATKVEKEVEETTPKPKKDTEHSPEFNEADNEISHIQPEKSIPFERDVETLDDGSSRMDYADLLNEDLVQHPNFEFNNRNHELEHLPVVKDIESNDVNYNQRDLSDDIYINQMMADQGYPHDPRAEVFEVDPNYQIPLNNDAFYNQRYYYGS